MRGTDGTEARCGLGGAGWGDGVRRALPLAAGVGVFGVVFGMAAVDAGVSPAQAIVMSLGVFSGAAQAALLSMWPSIVAAPRESLAVVALVVGLLCLRFTVMAATVRPLWKGRSRWRLALAAFFFIDETWAIGVGEARAPRPRLAVFVGAGVVLYVAWVGGVGVGAHLDLPGLDPRALALDFVIPGVLLLLLSGAARRADVLPGAVAAAVAWGLAPLGQGVALMGGAATGAAVGMIASHAAGRRR